MTKFRTQLAQYGLKVKEMGADGNCLFRSLADQLEGNEKLHRKYRQEACDFIEQNKEQYAPFIEDDETIDQYLEDMNKESTWGGQLELQALSLLYKFNYIVHQVDNPSMAFSSFDWGTVPTLHISYHLGEHYNSVRLIEDPCNGPPLTIGHKLEIKNPMVNMENNDQEEEKKQPNNDDDSISVIQNISYQNLQRDQLIQYAMTVTGLMEYDIMEKSMVECFGEHLEISFQSIDQTLSLIQKYYEDIEIESLQMNFAKTLTLNKEESKNSSTPQKSKSVNFDDEKIKELMKDGNMLDKDNNVISMPQKNKNCVCGSKKKYKICCFQRDQDQKDVYIEKYNKKVEEAKSINKGLLML
ncbi:UNKNOWN [Stylonychia lemnae]|uniref:OTU domain-containing protein n=1 Tax=Stylonychia lemnae TaxID=5949 RepID=A0A078B0M9_STYLE|nr:UNKNOWN [Stylonychia lemnae]|eukprot:CDW88215.1 UNKNOWN [Stylonychia lemnae]